MNQYTPSLIHGIGRKFIAQLLLFSSLLTLVITAIQVKLDFDHDKASVNEQLELIQSSFLNSLNTSLWVANQNLLQVQVTGILAMPDITYLKITEQNKVLIEAGEKPADRFLMKSFDLSYPYRGLDRPLGTLEVYASLEQVYGRIYDRIILILFSQGIKTFLVSGFMFLLFYHLVGKHINKLAALTRNLEFNQDGSQFTLDRTKPKHKDELDQLADSLVSMNQKVIASFQDLTQEIEKRRHSEADLAWAQSVAKLGAWQWSLSPEQFFWSPGFIEIFAEYRATPPKDPRGLLRIISRTDRKRAIQHLRVLLRQQKSIKLDLQLNLPDGICFVHVEAQPVTVSGEKLSKIKGIMQDISMRKFYEMEIIEAKNLAETASQAKDQFLSIMSHELRTPMNGVLGLTQVLLESPLTEEQRHYCQTILKSGYKLVDILSSILQQTKISTGHLEPKGEPLDLKSTLSNIAALFSGAMSAKGIHFSLELAPELTPMYLGDERLLEQVISNLLGNAVKFTDRGKISLEASCLQIGRTSHRIRFKVCDTGIGIQPDQLQHIFQPFVQVDSSSTRQYEGIGLGLSISANIVGSMGGELQVESKPDQGSCFWFDLELPFLKETAATAQPVIDIPPKVEATQTTESTILLVEDDPTNQMVARRMLTGFGYAVVLAENGADAIELFEQHPVDLILMDYLMPVMNGIVATQIIRATAKGRQVPILGLTAKVLPEDKAHMLAAGMDAIIEKPLEQTKFAATLRNWLGTQDSPAS
ncbi:MAG: ATP-binding protein [bacterium]|nr:ATP-binding protein [bacterium]